MGENTLSKKLLPLYILVGVLLCWQIILTYQNNQTQWVCAQEVCAVDEPGGELWAEQNCGFINATNGEQQEVCRLLIDGQEQIVARDALNLSAIRNCVQYACIQEISVRDVNYTLE